MRQHTGPLMSNGYTEHVEQRLYRARWHHRCAGSVWCCCKAVTLGLHNFTELSSTLNKTS